MSHDLTSLVILAEGAGSDQQEEVLVAACHLLVRSDDPFNDRFHRLVAAGGYESAALALLERVLPGIWYVLAKGRLQASEPLFGCELLFGSDEQIAIADGPTLPLAIILATLKAKAGVPDV